VLAVGVVVAAAIIPLTHAQAGVETGLSAGLRYDADLSASVSLAVRLTGGGPMGVVSMLFPAAVELAGGWRFVFPDPDPEAVWLPWFAAGLTLHASLEGGPVQLGPAAWFGMAYRVSEAVWVEATFDVWVRPFPVRGEYRLAVGPVIAW
jgi:hypothetical protein